MLIPSTRAAKGEQRAEALDVLVGEDQGATAAEQVELVVGAAGEGLLDQIDAELGELWDELFGMSEGPAAVGVDAEAGAGGGRGDPADRRAIVRWVAAELDLQDREVGRLAGALLHGVELVEGDRVGGDGGGAGRGRAEVLVQGEGGAAGGAIPGGDVEGGAGGRVLGGALVCPGGAARVIVEESWIARHLGEQAEQGQALRWGGLAEVTDRRGLAVARRLVADGEAEQHGGERVDAAAREPEGVAEGEGVDRCFALHARDGVTPAACDGRENAVCGPGERVA